MSTTPEATLEEKELAKNTVIFIENTNLKSMMMIKEGILIAINELTLYKDPTGILCLEHKDVMNAIEEGYIKQVAAYDELRKGTLASGDRDNLEQVYTITEDIWAKARATPLPASNTNNSSNNSGYNANNGNNTNSGTRLSNSNLKKFRKAPHRKGLSRKNA
jgi:hypothetical protein